MFSFGVDTALEDDVVGREGTKVDAGFLDGHEYGAPGIRKEVCARHGKRTSTTGNEYAMIVVLGNTPLRPQQDQINSVEFWQTEALVQRSEVLIAGSFKVSDAATPFFLGFASTSERPNHIFLPIRD